MFLEDEATEENPEIGLTPLIDVVFQLLLFFMLTSTFAAPSMEIELPSMDAAAEAAEREQLTVSMGADGSLELDGNPLGDEFSGELQAAMQAAGTQAVFLRADGGVSYEKVLQLMRRLGEAGCTQINFVYERE